MALWVGSGAFVRRRIPLGVPGSAVNGWRATCIEHAAGARDIVFDLDVQYDTRGPRAADAIRRIEPARSIHRALWFAWRVFDVSMRDHSETNKVTSTGS